MELVITTEGQIRCIYGEEIDLPSLGRMQIRRASHVEPDGQGRWRADLSLVQGPVLGPFTHRREALEAESRWLANRWLIPG